MMRAEREELLRRYLDGEMNLEQEHDFIIQVALDKELRHELKAQQTIDKAFQKDRVVDPSAYTALQATVAAMIVSPMPGAEPAPLKTDSFLSRFFGSGTQRFVAGGVAGITLLGVAFLFGLPDQGETGPAAPHRTVRPAVSGQTSDFAPLESSSQSFPFLRQNVVQAGDITAGDAVAGATAQTLEEPVGTTVHTVTAVKGRAVPAAIHPVPNAQGVGSSPSTPFSAVPTRNSSPSAAPAHRTPANAANSFAAADTVLNSSVGLAADNTGAIRSFVDSSAATAKQGAPAKATEATEVKDSIGIGVRLLWKNE